MAEPRPAHRQPVALRLSPRNPVQTLVRRRRKRRQRRCSGSRVGRLAVIIPAGAAGFADQFHAVRERPEGREAAFDCFVVQPQHATRGDRANGVLRIVGALQRGPARLIHGVDVLRRNAVQAMVHAACDHP